MYQGSVIDDLIASVELVENRVMFPICMQESVRVHAAYMHEFTYVPDYIQEEAEVA